MKNKRKMKKYKQWLPITKNSNKMNNWKLKRFKQNLSFSKVHNRFKIYKNRNKNNCNKRC